MYFDTHAHYDDEAFDCDREEVLSKLPGLGIELIVNPGSGKESSGKAVRLARGFSNVYAAVGWHPHEAGGMGADGEEFLKNLCDHEKVVAIGEIGLDYHYDFSPRDIQREIFSRQLKLALELKLPVIVHDREAHEDCLDIIRRYPEVPGVMHCYSGSAELAKQILDLGWYLSFTGAVTFKNARRALETIAMMPRERIMIETDSPYLTPAPHRGRRNDSGYLPIIAQAVGAAMGIGEKEAARITTENGRRFFGV